MKRMLSTLFAITMLFFVCLPEAKVSADTSISITTTTLPAATVGQSYSADIYFTKTTNYALNATISGQPSGIGFGGVSGPNANVGIIFNYTTISGIPTQAGTYTMRLTLTDQYNPSVSKDFTLVVNPVASFSIDTTQLPAAQVNIPYSANIAFRYTTSATNYASNATFSGLPPGITTGSASGPNTTYGIIYNNPGLVTISGTPTTVGAYTVTVSLTDQYSANLSKQFILVVNNPSSPAPVPQPVSGAAHINYTNVAAPDGTVYRIENGTRFPYTSAGAFLSYGFNTWATVAPATSGDMALPVATYTPSGSTQQTTYFIPPRNGSLINDKGTIYLITNGLRIGFASAQSFLELGYSFANAQPGDTSFMVTLAPINNSATAHPDGTLIRDNKTVYLMKNNVKMGIPSMEVFYSWGLNMNEVVPANSYDRAAPQSGVLNIRMENQLSV